MSNIFNETLSLAALFQSCAHIQRIARTGQGDESAMAPVIRGLIITNPKAARISTSHQPWPRATGRSLPLLALAPRRKVLMCLRLPLLPSNSSR